MGQSRWSEKDVLDAYTRAWRVREQTGLRDDQTLQDYFVEYVPGHDVLEAGTDERNLWFEAWRNDVPPKKVGRFGLQYSSRLLADDFREIARIVRPSYPDWMDLPPGLRKMSKGWLGSDADGIKMATFDFQASDDIRWLIDRISPIEVNKKGFRKIPVWLDLVEEGYPRVFVGHEPIGFAVTSSQSWSSLTHRRRRGARKVPDGSIQVRVSTDGSAEFRKLRLPVSK